MSGPSLAAAVELWSGDHTAFSLFATAFAAGIAAMLPLVPIRQIGRRFFVLVTLVAVVFYALALTSRGLAISYLHASAAGLLLLYNVFVSEQGGAVSVAVLLAALGCGAAGLIGDALEHPPGLAIAGPQSLWLAVTFLGSALVLGGALVAMLLGHWYLVARGLSFDVLARIVHVLLAALVVRAAAGVWIAVCQRELWERLWAEAGSAAGFFTSSGLFVGVRVIFGLALPVVLVLMARACVRIRSNQSATGILYVVVAFVIIGEAIAKHMLVADGVVL